MFPLLLQTIISNQMRPRRLRGAWFSRLLRHPTRRRSGSILRPRTHTGCRPDRSAQVPWPCHGAIANWAIEERNICSVIIIILIRQSYQLPITVASIHAPHTTINQYHWSDFITAITLQQVNHDYHLPIYSSLLRIHQPVTYTGQFASTWKLEHVNISTQRQFCRTFQDLENLIFVSEYFPGVYGPKVAVMAFRVLHGLMPPYLNDLVRVADLPGRRRLCSSSSHQLLVESFWLTTVGRRTFPVAASLLWNSLPSDIQSSPSLPVFRQHLKHSFFHNSFPT